MTREEAIEFVKDAFIAWESEYRVPHEDWTETHKARDMAIEALSAERTWEWIPCSERLPDERKSVLITDGDFSAEGEYAGNGRWAQYLWSSLRNDITAWMPLPEPYREDG